MSYESRQDSCTPANPDTLQVGQMVQLSEAAIERLREEQKLGDNPSIRGFVKDVRENGVVTAILGPHENTHEVTLNCSDFELLI